MSQLNKLKAKNRNVTSDRPIDWGIFDLPIEVDIFLGIL